MADTTNTQEVLKEFEGTLEKYKTQIEAKATEIAKASGDKAVEAAGALKTDLAEVKTAIDGIQAQIKAMNAARIPGLDGYAEMDEKKKAKVWSWGSFLRAQMNAAKPDNPWMTSVERRDPWALAGPEKEIIAEAEAKMRAVDANVAGDGTQGGYLVPDEVASEVVGLTMDQMPIMQLGPRVLSGLVGDLPVPRITGRPTAHMVGEVQAPAVSKAAYGSEKMSPHKAAAYTRQSMRLIYQSRGVSDQIIKDVLAEAMALKKEEQILIGTGTGYQVKGLYTYGDFTASNIADLAGTQFKLTHISDMLMALDVAKEYGPGGNFGLLMRPENKWGLLSQGVAQFSGQARNDQQLLLPGSLLLKPEDIQNQYSVKLGSTTLIPKTNERCDVIAGNFKFLWIGNWRGMRINVSNEASDGSGNSAFLQDELYIVMFEEFDAHVPRTSAFTKVTGAGCDRTTW